jgi:hypothetical protein
VVETFLAASRARDVDAVIAVLAPDVVRRADRAALPAGRATEARGVRDVAAEIVDFGRSARFAELALINGAVGLVVAPHGRLRLALTVTIEGERIAGYELIADPARPRPGVAGEAPPPGPAPRASGAWAGRASRPGPAPQSDAAAPSVTRSRRRPRPMVRVMTKPLARIAQASQKAAA